MPESPDFDQIARRLFALLDLRAEDEATIAAQVAVAVEQFRQVWNARGAADAKAVEDRLSTLVGWITSEPYAQHLREAIAALDGRK